MGLKSDSSDYTTCIDIKEINQENESCFWDRIAFFSLLCAILVIFIHSYNITEDNTHFFPARIIEQFISENIAQVAVPFFFIMSAFVFFRNFEFSKLFGKYKKRLLTVFVPYLILFYFISRFSFVNIEPFELTFSNITEGIFLYKYNQVFWFMGQLIINILLTPLIYILVKNKWIGAFVIIGIFMCFAVGLYVPYFRIDSFFYYIF